MRALQYVSEYKSSILNKDMVYNGSKDGEFWTADFYKLWTIQRTVITLVCAIYL